MKIEKQEKPIKKIKNKQSYPGVKYNERIKKWIATLKKGDMVMVSTKASFEEAKRDMVTFESS